MTKDALHEVFGPIWLAEHRQADALERIAAALERIAQAADSAGDEADMGCPHPLEKRLALGTVGDGWQCACGHREPPQKV
jgi:hypothetical protein